MRLLLAIPLVAAILSLSSCVVGGKAAKTPAVPAAPVATAVAKPAAPPPPVSSPQTEIQLPPAQPVSPEALATIDNVRQEEPAPEPEPVAKPPASRRPASPPLPAPAAANPPRQEPPATAETPVQPPAATPAPEESPRLQPAYSDEERRRTLAELERRRAEIESLLKGVNQSRISADQKAVIDRIRSFQTVADEAAKRLDFRSADAISERALILAKELANGR
jgi:hypothetical protein